MSSLSSILLSAQAPEALVGDLARAVDKHIQGRGGLKGAAMKMGYSAMKAAKPDIAERAVRALLPDIAKALDPLHAEFSKSGTDDFGLYLGQHATRAAAVVIAVADQRVAASPNAPVKAVYQRFRGGAEDELEKLLPSLGRVLASHIA